MRLCVFGASGPVGRATVHRALEDGHDVTAVTRHPESWGPVPPRLRVVSGDVLEPSAVAAALSEADAVISTIGVLPTRRPVDTYSVGVGTILDAMRTLGLTRIVCVSSKELDEEGVRDEPLLYRFVFARLLAVLNRSIYADMRRMEGIVRASGCDWTIVRPAGLFAADRVSDYRCPSGHEPGVSTSTADLADALVSAAAGDRHLGETLQVLTDSGRPPYLLLLARQVSLHRR